MTDTSRYTRRSVLAVGAAGIAAASIGMRVPAGRAATSGAVWAVQVNDNLSVGGGSPSYWTYVAQLEQKLGRPFAGFRRNGITSSADHVAYDKAYDRGWRWGYANGKWDAGTAANLWRDTAAGRWDAQYTALFKSLKTDTRWTASNPFHFSFHHEQYVKSENGGIGAGTAAQYIAAFRHVRSLMDAAAAHVSKRGNCLMCFVPHVNQFLMDPVYGSKSATSAVAPFVVSKLDPGKDSYDKTGADIYLRTRGTASAAEQWGPVHHYALDRGMSFFTGETGIAGTDTKVVAYLRQLDTLLKAWGGGAGPGQCEAICWTTRVTGTDDDRLDATSAKLAQYKTMAQDPYYGGSV